MNKPFVRQRLPICQFCEHLTGSAKPLPRIGLEVLRFRRREQSKNIISIRPASTKTLSPHLPTSRKATPTVQGEVQKTALDAELEFAQEKTQAVLSSASIPSEEAVLNALDSYEFLAYRLTQAPEYAISKSDNETTPASALLSLDEKPNKSTTIPPSRQRPVSKPQTGQKAIDALSALAARVIRHPNVFITPEILTSYVDVQSILRRPETFAEVFDLYARKPVPQPNTTPTTFTTPNPNKAQSAIPSPVAEAALTSAIDRKNLPLAVSIIENTYCTTAYRRSKFIKQALLPLIGVALAPAAAYTVATQVAQFQDTMDTATATNIAFAGIFSYIAFTATIGFVALTTSNDQMNRVTWATGLPLRERWMREKERAAIDRVASAWGFKETDRRGEEEGEEWEALREWIGMKGMVLDRPELMEGME